MNKKIKIIILIIVLLVVSVITFFIIDGYNYSYNFDNATRVLDVIVKDEDTEKLNYYSVYDDQRIKEIDKFEVENNITYSLNDCLGHVQKEDANIIISDSCKIIDGNNNEITPTTELKNIIFLLSNLGHQIFDKKVFKVDDKYYIMTELNVNWWSPYELYSYDVANNKLNLLYVFDGEEIIGIK